MVTSVSPAAVELTDEFQVTSNPAEYAGPPFALGTAVAGRPDGSYLIAFEGLIDGSDGGDDSNYQDIIARSFGPSGALGPDFRINTETRDGQFSPSVAATASGYVAAYSSGEENLLYGTYAASQLFSVDGALTAPESFNNYSDYNRAPSVAALSAGGYVVTSSQENEFQAQIHDANGGIVTRFGFGGEHNGGGGSSIVATSPTGFELFWHGFAVADGSSEDSGPVGIYVQAATTAGVVGTPTLLLAGGGSVSAARLTDGNIVVGGLIVDPTTQQVVGGTAQQVAVAALDDGGYVAVRTGTGADGDGDGAGIRAQVFDADGSARGASFVVNQQTAGNQGGASVAAIGNDDFVVSWIGPDGVKAATFSADGVTAPDPSFQVNTTTANDQGESSVARLANGNIVVVWSDESRIDASDRSEIRGQLFTAEGSRIGGEFTVNSTHSDVDRTPDVTANADGGFTVAWQHGEDESYPGSTAAIQRFAADATRIGPELFTSDSSFGVWPEVADVGGGRTLVTSQDLDQVIHGHIYKTNGASTASFTIGLNTAHNLLNDVAGLRGGGAVVAYSASDPGTDADGPTGPVRLHVATYSSAGALLADRIVMPDATGDELNPALAALPDGGFAVTWEQAGAGGGMDVLSQVYDGRSNAVGGPVLVADGVSLVQSLDPRNPLGGGDAHDPNIAALADGRYVVSWTTAEDGVQTIHNQVFTTNGDRSGAEQDHLVTSATSADAAIAGDGAHGFVVSFTDDGAGSDGSGSAVRAQLFTAENLIQGGAAAETLAGTVGGDTIYAGNGNDRVDGNGGDDLIYAGSGLDTVHGNAGNDLIYGELQIDTLYGDAGNDTIVGDTSEIAGGARAPGDTIDGGVGDDALYGDAYVIRAGGFGGRDTITGGDGNDHIWGDARTLQAGAHGGADFLFGGAGNDVIYGDGQFQAAGATGGNDRIDGGAGDDDLWGGGGNDMFVFSAKGFGSDVVHDFGQAAGDRDGIDLRALHISYGSLQISYADGNAFVAAPGFGGGTIELVGVSSLGQADFLL